MQSTYLPALDESGINGCSNTVAARILEGHSLSIATDSAVLLDHVGVGVGTSVAESGCAVSTTPLCACCCFGIV